MLFLTFGGSFALHCLPFFHLSVSLISYLMTKLPAPTNMLNEDMNLSRTYKMRHSLDVTMSEFFSLEMH